jgi:hypothetical protein
MNRRLHWPQNQYGCFGVERNSLPLLGTFSPQPNHYSRLHSVHKNFILFSYMHVSIPSRWCRKLTIQCKQRMTLALMATAAWWLPCTCSHCNIPGILSVNFMFGTQTLQLSLNCVVKPSIKGHNKCDTGWRNHHELYCYRNLHYHATLHTQ